MRSADNDELTSALINATSLDDSAQQFALLDQAFAQGGASDVAVVMLASKLVVNPDRNIAAQAVTKTRNVGIDRFGVLTLAAEHPSRYVRSYALAETLMHGPASPAKLQAVNAFTRDKIGSTADSAKLAQRQLRAELGVTSLTVAREVANRALRRIIYTLMAQS